MRKDQIEIKFLKLIKKGKKKGQHYCYPKPYVFNLTPKARDQWGDQLTKGNVIIVEIPRLISAHKLDPENTICVPVVIADVGHFNNGLHKPLKIVKTAKEKAKAKEKKGEE